MQQGAERKGQTMTRKAEAAVIRWSVEDMNAMADMLMADSLDGRISDCDQDHLNLVVEGTGWNVREFEGLCMLRWNGPVWAQ